MRSSKGRTELQISLSRAKNCEEVAGDVRFCVAPQKHHKNYEKRTIFRFFFENLFENTFFRKFRWFSEELRKNGRHQQLPWHFSLQINLFGARYDLWSSSWDRVPSWDGLRDRHASHLGVYVRGGVGHLPTNIKW